MDAVFMWMVLITSICIADSLKSFPATLQINVSEPLVRRVGDDLHLNCSVFQPSTNYKFKMQWLPPNSLVRSDDRLFVEGDYNEILLHIINLKEYDKGTYSCEAHDIQSGSMYKNISLNIMPKKGTCTENHFRCSTSGHCISLRYACDGFEDCPDKTDESMLKCGPNPCEGKILCNDGRCLDRKLCCDPYLESNCPTHINSCCMRFIHSTYSMIHPSVDQQKRYDSDLGFLQSTIYTVIGCAVAFVFIITIMVIAVCRVHLKRSTLPSHPHGRGSVSIRSQIVTAPWEQNLSEEVFLGEVREPFLYGSPTPTPANSANLLVAYNINNGMHFVGRLVKPPSYSQIAHETHAPNDPPPPYHSTDSLCYTQTNGNNSVCTMTPILSYSQYTTDVREYSSSMRPNIIVNHLSDSE